MSDKKSEAAATLKQLHEYSVPPSDLVAALKHLLSPFDAAGNPKEQSSVMIWGAMGIGKTELVRELAKKWNSRVVALHLPQFDPTDIKGIPVKIGDTVKWVASSFLPQEIDIVIDRDMVDEKGALKSKFEFGTKMVSADDVSVTILDRSGKVVYRHNDQMCGSVSLMNANSTVDMVHKEASLHMTPDDMHPDLIGYTIRLTDKAILFLDELSAAVPQVQNAALQLVLDKRVSEYVVPSTTPIVAAGNRESDAAFVHPMSAPLSNRFCHLRLVPSLQDWIEWALPRKVHPHVIGYLQWKGSKSLLDFEPDKMEEGDGGFATPRSWYKLSQQMTRELPTAVMNAIIAGFIGKSKGTDFIAYRDICELLPSTDEILQGRITNFDKDLDNGQKYGLATALCYKLKDYHDMYYDEDISTDEPNQQKQAWRVATSSFCDFIHKHLGPEMTVLCIHIVSRHLDISFIKFKGDHGNVFAEFSRKYRDILVKVI